MRGLYAIVLELRTGFLPNAPSPLPPRSTFSSMRVTYDLSSLTSVPFNSNARGETN
jgi:hypothetical protein